MTRRQRGTGADTPRAGSRPRVVVVGGGFAGYNAARSLSRTMGDAVTVPGHPEVFACGDAAAVPDPGRPGQFTAMTAQHAERQGRLAGRNVAASLGRGRSRRYRHRDLGFLVDLGSTDAAANPLHLRLSGLPAKTITRGYHLLSMPGNRLRTAADWVLDAVLPRQSTQLGLVRSVSVPLDTSSPEVPHHPQMAFPPERSSGGAASA